MLEPPTCRKRWTKHNTYLTCNINNTKYYKQKSWNKHQPGRHQLVQESQRLLISM